MIGAIISDVISSAYEFWPAEDKVFLLWNKNTEFIDDTVMTIAVGRAILRYRNGEADFAKACTEEMQKLGRKYPHAGYGHGFRVVGERISGAI